MNDDDLRHTLHSLASDIDAAPDALVSLRRRTSRKRRLHQGVIGGAVAVVAVVVLAFVVPGTASRHVDVINPTGPPPSATSTVPAATSVPQTAPTVTTIGPITNRPQTVAPVVACPSTYGSGAPPSGTPLGPTMSLNLPFAAQLSFYSNSTRTITPVLGPRGWACHVTVGGDGSTDVDVYPVGGAAPRGGSLGTTGSPGIDAASDSACQGCVYGTVCPFVPSALGQLGYSSQTGFTCSPLPKGTTVDFVKGSPTAAGPIIKDIIAFDIPTTSAPTSGIVLYDNQIGQGGSGSASQETCTLPSTQHALCTAILANFTAAAWMMNS